MILASLRIVDRRLLPTCDGCERAGTDGRPLRTGRLDAPRNAMYRAIEKGGPAAYAVRRDRIERTWP